MADFLSQATPYVITVLEGPLSNGSPILLEGRALPYRGFSYETEQRTKTTYYPGNPVATQQVMGPVEKPTVVNGVWKDRFLGNGAARELVITFEEVVRTGPAVEVKWGTGVLPDGTLIGKPIVRRGILRRFKHTYDRPQDIAWEMEFEWRGRDEVTAPTLFSAGILNPGEGFVDLSDKLFDAQSDVEAFRDSPLARVSGFAQSFLESVDDAVSSSQDTTRFLDDIADTVTTVSELPNAVIERVRGLAVGAIDSYANFIQALLAQPESLMEARDSALALLDLKDRLFDLLRSSDVAMESASNTNDALAAQAKPDVIAEVRAVPGTDLRDLAQQFYGDPDAWWIIAEHNDLESSKVPAPPTGPSDDPARPLAIPRRPDSGVGDLSRAC